MTPEQFSQQQAMLQSILDAVNSGVSVLHYISGVCEFGVHLLSGLVYLGIGYGIVTASQLRRRGQ